MGHLFWSKDAQENQRSIVKLFHQNLMLDIWLKSTWKEFICWWVNKSKPKMYYVHTFEFVYLIHIYYNEIKKPHLAPVKLWWILLKDVSALIDSFASNVNYGVHQGFCLHWSNLLPYHSVNGRTGCWVFSLETWKFHTSEIQLVQCLEKIQKYSLTVQSLY